MLCFDMTATAKEQRIGRNKSWKGERERGRERENFEVDINHMKKVQHTIVIIIIICEWLESLALTNIINTFFMLSYYWWD